MTGQFLNYNLSSERYIHLFDVEEMDLTGINASYLSWLEYNECPVIGESCHRTAGNLAFWPEN